MFMTMIAPLFNAVMLLLNYEPGRTHQQGLVRLYRGLFKQFMGLAKRTSTELVEEMIGKDLLKMAEEECQIAKEKWEMRVQRQEIACATQRTKAQNKLKGVPKEWVELVNLQTRMCPFCKRPSQAANPWHLKYWHNIEVKHVMSLWQKEICPLSEDIAKKSGNRRKADSRSRVKIEEARQELHNLVKSQLQKQKALLEGNGCLLSSASYLCR